MVTQNSNEDEKNVLVFAKELIQNDLSKKTKTTEQINQLCEQYTVIAFYEKTKLDVKAQKQYSDILKSISLDSSHPMASTCK